VEIGRGIGLETGRTVAVNALVMGEIFYLFNSRYLFASVLDREGLLGNRSVLIAIGILVVMQILFTYVPLMQRLFGTAGLSLSAWWRIVVFGALLFTLVEFEKALLRRRKSISS
jgi:magnesium-transporting ATPase (P-type)